MITRSTGARKPWRHSRAVWLDSRQLVICGARLSQRTVNRWLPGMLLFDESADIGNCQFGRRQDFRNRETLERIFRVGVIVNRQLMGKFLCGFQIQIRAEELVGRGRAQLVGVGQYLLPRLRDLDLSSGAEYRCAAARAIRNAACRIGTADKQRSSRWARGSRAISAATGFPTGRRVR